MYCLVLSLLQFLFLRGVFCFLAMSDTCTNVNSRYSGALLFIPTLYNYTVREQECLHKQSTCVVAVCVCE